LADHTLRPARQADAPAIRALIRAAGINPTGLAWRRFVLAVSPEGELLGCGQVKPHDDGSRELASIAVQPGFRRRGIARAVIERLLAENPPPLHLVCQEKLGPFYARFGFRAVGGEEMPPYFRRLARAARLFMKVNLLVMLLE
jgi:N-acetylglutamate synthase-like GNAT family acetyltransferase